MLWRKVTQMNVCHILMAFVNKDLIANFYTLDALVVNLTKYLHEVYQHGIFKRLAKYLLQHKVVWQTLSISTKNLVNH